MSYFSDFGAAAFGSLAGNVQADIDSERSLKEQERLMQIQEKLRKKADEMRVAAKKMFLQKGVPSDQGPMPDKVMVEEFNNMGRPISTRPAGPGESEEYNQTQAATALAQQKIESDIESKANLDAATIRYRNTGSDKNVAATELSRAKITNPERFQSNPAAPKGPDYDKMIDNANKILGSIEDPQIKAGLQAEVDRAISKLKPKPDGTPGVDSEVAAQMLVIAIRNAREAEAMKGGKKPSSGNSAEPTSSGQKL